MSAREQASTVGTRGIYENDKVRGYVSAYDDVATHPGRNYRRSNGGAFSADAPVAFRRIRLDGF